MSSLKKIEKHRFKLDKTNNCGCTLNAKIDRCRCTADSKENVRLPLLHSLAVAVASDDSAEDSSSPSEYGSRVEDGATHVKLPHIHSSNSCCPPSLVSKKQKHRRQNSKGGNNARRSPSSSSESKLCRESCSRTGIGANRCCSSCAHLPAIRVLSQKRVRCSPEQKSTRNDPKLPDILPAKLVSGEKAAPCPAADRGKEISRPIIALRNMPHDLVPPDGSKFVSFTSSDRRAPHVVTSSDRQAPHVVTKSGFEPSRANHAPCAHALLVPLRGSSSHAHAHALVKKR